VPSLSKKSWSPSMSVMITLFENAIGRVSPSGGPVGTNWKSTNDVPLITPVAVPTW
jgi:hypothetical protein